MSQDDAATKAQESEQEQDEAKQEMERLEAVIELAQGRPKAA